MMNSEWPPIELWYTRPGAQPPWREVYMVCFYQGKWSSRKLFVIGDIEEKYVGLSADKRWHYTSTMGNGTFLGELGKPKFKKLDEGLYNCRFSPDSRYLLGYGEGELVLFTVPDGQKKSLYKSWRDGREGFEPKWFGWYPDSCYAWFALACSYVNPAYKEPFYRINVLTGKRRRLSPTEGEAIKKGWGFLDERCAEFPRHWLSDQPKTFHRIVYSSDSKLRLHSKRPDFEYFVPAKERQGRAELVLEWRRGRSEVLVKAKEHLWYDIIPNDVTVDGKWAFWGGLVNYEPAVYAAVIMDVPSRRWWELFTEIPDFGGYPGIGWFGKEQDGRG